MALIFSNRKWAVEAGWDETVNQLFKITKAPQAIGPYSSAYYAWDLLFCSWQLAFDPATMELIEWWIEEQTRQVCRNIWLLLEENNMSLKDVVKTTVFLKDMNDFHIMNEIYKNYFILKPARSTIEVSRLPKDALVEIEVIAKR